jgi:hypothetical protein
LRSHATFHARAPSKTAARVAEAENDMKRLCVLVVGILLAGCAGTDKKLVRHELANEVDNEKIAAVNQWASAHGAVITWLHMPTKVREPTKDKDRD